MNYSLRCAAVAGAAFVVWIVLVRLWVSGAQIAVVAPFVLAYAGFALLESVARTGPGPTVVSVSTRHGLALGGALAIAVAMTLTRRFFGWVGLDEELTLLLAGILFRFRSGLGAARRPRLHLLVAFGWSALIGIAALRFPAAWRLFGLAMLFMGAALLTVPWWAYGESNWERYQRNRALYEQIQRALDGEDDVLLVQSCQRSARREFTVFMGKALGKKPRRIAAEAELVEVDREGHFVLIEAPEIVHVAGGGDDYRGATYERLVKCVKATDLGAALPSLVAPPSPAVLQGGFALVHLAFALGAQFVFNRVYAF